MIKVTGVKDTIVRIQLEHKAALRKEKQAVAKQLVERLKEATPVDTGEAREGWRSEGNSIVNDVEHIAMLNDGSSQQAPSHFIEQVVLSHPGIRPNGSIVTSK